MSVETPKTLREDSDFYCVLWLGIALLGAYYFNTLYLMATLPEYLSAVLPYYLQLEGLPLLLVVLFFIYLRSSRGRYRPGILALSFVMSLYFILVVTRLPEVAGVNSDWLFLSSWGIGSALLVAGAFSMMPRKSETVSPGIMDVSSLKYDVASQEESAETG